MILFSSRDCLTFDKVNHNEIKIQWNRIRNAGNSDYCARSISVSSQYLVRQEWKVLWF